MSAPSIAALQIAIYGALSGSAALTTVLGAAASTRVFDHVPENTPFPYIVIGDDETSRFDTYERGGIDVLIELNVFDRSDATTGRRGRLKTRQVLDAIYGVLHNQSLTVTGNAHVMMFYEGGGTILEDDGLSYRGIAQYGIFTQAT